MILRVLLGVLWAALWLVLGLAGLWAFGALWFDFPVVGMRPVAAVVFAIGLVAAVFFLRGGWRKALAVVLAVALVAGWWLTIKPQLERDWQPEMGEVAWMEMKGDEVTVHQVRNFEYRTPKDFTPRWETRTVSLAKLKAADVIMDTWGSEYMAHPIVSFEFEEGPPLAFSVETRREKHEGFSALGGLYRMFELIYLVGDERDMLALRQLKGNELHLYRTTMSKEAARQRFLEYMQVMNALRVQPRWYNVITSNCTTSLRAQHPIAQRSPWDWRILINGRLDELFYDTAMIETGGLPFADLRKQAFINEAVAGAAKAPDFSRKIREGRVGFGDS